MIIPEHIILYEIVKYLNNDDKKKIKYLSRYFNNGIIFIKPIKININFRYKDKIYLDERLNDLKDMTNKVINVERDIGIENNEDIKHVENMIIMFNNKSDLCIIMDINKKNKVGYEELWDLLVSLYKYQFIVNLTKNKIKINLRIRFKEGLREKEKEIIKIEMLGDREIITYDKYIKNIMSRYTDFIFQGINIYTNGDFYYSDIMLELLIYRSLIERLKELRIKNKYKEIKIMKNDSNVRFIDKMVKLNNENL